MPDRLTPPANGGYQRPRRAVNRDATRDEQIQDMVDAISPMRLSRDRAVPDNADIVDDAEDEEEADDEDDGEPIDNQVEAVPLVHAVESEEESDEESDDRGAGVQEERVDGGVVVINDDEDGTDDEDDIQDDREGSVEVFSSDEENVRQWSRHEVQLESLSTINLKSEYFEYFSYTSCIRCKQTTKHTCVTTLQHVLLGDLHVYIHTHEHQLVLRAL